MTSTRGQKRPKSARAEADALFAVEIAAADAKSRKRYGGSRIHRALGEEAHAGSNEAETPILSSDGAFITFRSVATNLIASDPNQASDLFITSRR